MQDVIGDALRQVRAEMWAKPAIKKEKSLNLAVRIIIDSNVLISAFVKSDSPPNQLVNAWWDGRFELVTGATQIEEIVRVARYPQIQEIVKPAEIGWLINRLRDRAIIIGRLPRGRGVG